MLVCAPKAKTPICFQQIYSAYLLHCLTLSEMFMRNLIHRNKQTQPVFWCPLLNAYTDEISKGIHEKRAVNEAAPSFLLKRKQILSLKG